MFFRLIAITCPEQSESVAQRGAERSEHRRVPKAPKDCYSAIKYRYIMKLNYPVLGLATARAIEYN